MRTPSRILLVNQVADVLRDEILRSTWKEWLPPTRELSSRLKVSRQTIQFAIKVLSEEGRVAAAARSGIRILPGVRRIKSKSPRSKQIGLLVADHATPQPFQYDAILRELEDIFFHNQIELSLHRGERYFRLRSQKALEELVKRNPVDCWILRTSNPRVQDWFGQRQIPCVIWGLGGEGKASIPSIGIDIAAATRHAVGVFLGLGHRQIALFCEHSANTNRTREEFAQSISASKHQDVDFTVWEHQDDARSIRCLLKRCMETRRPPTGIFVTRTYGYVAIHGALIQMRLRVPDDVSIISRDADSLFEFMLPKPSYFSFSAERFARELYYLSDQTAQGHILANNRLVLLPEFIRGESIQSPG